MSDRFLAAEELERRADRETLRSIDASLKRLVELQRLLNSRDALPDVADVDGLVRRVLEAARQLRGDPVCTPAERLVFLLDSAEIGVIRVDCLVSSKWTSEVSLDFACTHDFAKHFIDAVNALRRRG